MTDSVVIQILVLLVTIPFWTNLLIRTYCWVLLLREQGHAAEARCLVEQALVHQEQALRIDPTNPAYLRYLCNHCGLRTELLVRAGEEAEALPAIAATSPPWRSSLPSAPTIPNTTASWQTA